MKKRNRIHRKKRDNLIEGCKVTYEFVIGRKTIRALEFFITLTNMSVE